MTLRQYQNLINFLNFMINISHDVLIHQSKASQSANMFCIRRYEAMRNKALHGNLSTRDKYILVSDWHDFEKWSNQKNLNDFDTSYHTF